MKNALQIELNRVSAWRFARRIHGDPHSTGAPLTRYGGGLLRSDRGGE